MTIAPTQTLPSTAPATSDPYALAQTATQLLLANPANPEAGAAYNNALGALKLSAAPIPWSSRARRLNANLKSLAPHVSAETLAAISATAQALPQTHALYQSPDQNFQILDLRKPQPSAWLGGLLNHKASTSLWNFDKSKTPMPAPLAFDGLGHGYVFLHIFNTTQNSFLNYSCPLYILESNPVHLAILLHLHDLQHIFASPRLRFFLNPNEQESLAVFQSALEQNRSWTLPQLFVRVHFEPRPLLPIEQIVSTVQAARKIQFTQQQAQIQSHYQNKTPADWHARFEAALAGTAPPLKVLGITSRYTTVLQYSLAEMQSAIAASSIPASMQIAIEPDDQSHENPYHQLIAEYQPDLLFQISRLRHEDPNMPANIPFICWDQDNLPCMRTPEATAALQQNPLTFIAGHGAVFGYANLNWPRKNLIFCHAAGAAHRYHNTPISPSQLAPHICDFSYTSNASGSPQSLAAEIRKRYQGRLASLFDQLIQQIQDYSAQGRTFDYITIHRNTRELAISLNIELPANISHELAMDLHRFADRAFRHATLQWVSRYCLANHKTLRLYGRGWESNPEFSRWASGIADPGEHSRAIYQATRINLQIIETGFIHSRSLDGLAAGGFFMARDPLIYGVATDETTTLYSLAKWTKENNITDESEIKNTQSPQVRQWLEKTHCFFDRHNLRWALSRSLHIWAELPPAPIAIPLLADVTFTNESEFSRLATTFLDDDARRTQIASAMRNEILNSFSYDARWNSFLSSIRTALTPAPELLTARY